MPDFDQYNDPTDLLDIAPEMLPPVQISANEPNTIGKLVEIHEMRFAVAELFLIHDLAESFYQRCISAYTHTGHLLNQIANHQPRKSVKDLAELKPQIAQLITPELKQSLTAARAFYDLLYRGVSTTIQSFSPEKIQPRLTEEQIIAVKSMLKHLELGKDIAFSILPNHQMKDNQKITGEVMNEFFKQGTVISEFQANQIFLNRTLEEDLPSQNSPYEKFHIFCHAVMLNLLGMKESIYCQQYGLIFDNEKFLLESPSGVTEMLEYLNLALEALKVTLDLDYVLGQILE